MDKTDAMETSNCTCLSSIWQSFVSWYVTSYIQHKQIFVLD